MTESEGIRATKTAFDIVEAILFLENGGVSEIAKEVDMPVSTVYDHLSTLVDCKVVIKEGDTYTLSTRLLSIGTRERQQRPIFDLGMDSVLQLAAETGEYVSLGVREMDYLILLYNLRRPEGFTVEDVYDGRRLHLHSNAMGKAYLAHLPEADIQTLEESVGFPALTENTITDLDVLTDELDEIRDRGYALDEEQIRIGLNGVAAPIITNEAGIEGVLGVYGPTRRMNIDRIENEIVEPLLSKTNLIQVSFDYS